MNSLSECFVSSPPNRLILYLSYSWTGPPNRWILYLSYSWTRTPSAHAKGGSCPKLCARTQRACGASQTSEKHCLDVQSMSRSENITFLTLLDVFTHVYTFFQLCARSQHACGTSQTSEKTRPGFSEHVTAQKHHRFCVFGGNDP